MGRADNVYWWRLGKKQHTGGGMDLTYKPAGYSSVSPYLIVDGAPDTIAFLRTVFDAVELRRVELENGKLRHAELRLDDTVIMLGDRTDSSP